MLGIIVLGMTDLCKISMVELRWCEALESLVNGFRKAMVNGIGVGADTVYVHLQRYS